MGMVLVAPTDVVPKLAAVTVLGLLAACSAALGQKPRDQQLIPPENRACICGIKQAADKGKRIRLVHAFQDRRNLGNSFGNTSFMGD